VDLRKLGRFGGALTLSVMLALFLTGCGNKNATTGTDDTAANAGPAIKTGVKPEADSEVAVVELENPAYGKMVIELYPNIAPKMVERFKQLVKEGFYDGTTFHRIDPELGIIQGGDPNSRDNDLSNDGAGDSLYPNVPGEFSDVPFDRGIVGAARKGENRNPRAGPIMTDALARDTNNCQFYVTLRRVPAFDGNYVVFGKVIEGIGNADVIANAPVVARGGGGPPTSPVEKITIKKITLQPHK